MLNIWRIFVKSLSKKIFITGATHGIGRATAELFCQRGWSVYGISSNKEDGRGEELATKYDNFHYCVADVCDEQAVIDVLDKIGTIDAAFNNAGIGKEYEYADEEHIEKARKVIETNLIGTMICMKHEIKCIKKGVIVNNASVSANKALTGCDACYSASKAGILRLTAEAAACDKYLEQIKFFSILPGYIKTRMTAKDDLSKIRHKIVGSDIGMPDDVARLVFNAVENYECYSSGQCFNMDEGAFLI